jgi:hypothetical protein
MARGSKLALSKVNTTQATGIEHALPAAGWQKSLWSAALVVGLFSVALWAVWVARRDAAKLRVRQASSDAYPDHCAPRGLSVGVSGLRRGKHRPLSPGYGGETFPRERAANDLLRAQTPSGRRAIESSRRASCAGQRLAVGPIPSPAAAIKTARVPCWEHSCMGVNGLPMPIAVTRRGPHGFLGTQSEILSRPDHCLRPESVREVTQEPLHHRHVPPPYAPK